MTTDPVCGMTVEPEKAAAQTAYQGTTYYFCSAGCQKEFENDPENYVTAAGGDEPGSRPKH